MKNILRQIGNNLKNMDKILLVFIILFAAFGLVVVFSSSNIPAVLHYHYQPTYFFFKQLVVTIAGIIVMLVLAVKPKFPTWISKILTFVGLLIVFGLITYLLIKKNVINGSNSWMSGNIFSLQPSEFFKTYIIVALAIIYGTTKHYKNYFWLLLPVIVSMVIIGFVMLEPDFGTAAIIGFLVMFIFLTLPIKDKYIKISKYVIFILAIVGIVGIYLLQPKFIAKESTSRQLGRFAFTNPCSRSLIKTGYQVCNAYIAINNGGMFGRGLGNSTQKFLYLPEAFTDFVFPIVVEEIGVIGAVAVLLAYLFLLFKILVIARNATNLQDSIIAFGTFMYILLHILVNLLGVLALLPLTGVPLPFLSYGGSFLFNLFILLGLTLNVSANNRRAKKGV
ncbi:MAG: FtsW/RodA/SpoVE family cell cycle protein [Bacilli bacterium]|nr:FtsW/RodA/SpoVE family cell cycle protein [Bacilli bacterium]